MNRTDLSKEPEMVRRYFTCNSCRCSKPMSALKDVNTKRPWCITCFDRMIDNSLMSDGDKQQARFRKYRGRIEAYRNGTRNNRPLAQ